MKLDFVILIIILSLVTYAHLINGDIYIYTDGGDFDLLLVEWDKEEDKGGSNHIFNYYHEIVPKKYVKRNKCSAERIQYNKPDVSSE